MTITVKGDTVAYEETPNEDRVAQGVVIMNPAGGAAAPINANGRAAAASSTPVVLSTEDYNAQMGVTASDWTYAAANLGIVNTTTAVTIKAAAGGSLRNYLSSLQIVAEALGAATEVAIRDGAAGTVIWRIKIGTGGLVGGLNVNFRTPLRSTANTLLEVVTLTASVTGAVYVNAQGFAAL